MVASEHLEKFLFPGVLPERRTGRDASSSSNSTLMALLYDATLEFPGEWSTQQLPGSAKKNKKPSAWAEFYDEEDKPSRTERWAPRLLGEEDMVVSRPLKVHSANFVGLQCLISAALTGTRR